MWERLGPLASRQATTMHAKDVTDVKLALAKHDAAEAVAMLAAQITEAIQGERDRFKTACNGADPTHFCNECGSEFLSCCHKQMLRQPTESTEKP